MAGKRRTGGGDGSPPVSIPGRTMAAATSVLIQCTARGVLCRSMCGMDKPATPGHQAHRVAHQMMLELMPLQDHLPMRTTINIDDALLAKAAKLAGPLDRSAVV